MIAIVDYGVGNLFSLRASLDFLGIESRVTDDPRALDESDKIILPGVGAFGDAMAKLREKRLIPVLDGLVLGGKPLLGICLGMQMLFEESLEFGRTKGLGYLDGMICPLADDIPRGLKVPHIGWNALEILDAREPVLQGFSGGEHVYYVHSFYAKNCDASVKAVSEYGVPVPGFVRRENVHGMQFHPEKSGSVGLKLLKAFCDG